MRLRLLAVLAMVPMPVQAASSTPVEVVSAVIKLDTGSWGTLFDVKPTLLMTRYFTQAFNKSWVTAMAHNKDEPVLDGDPITGGQGVSGVRLKSTRATQDNDTASVSADVLVSEEGTKTARRTTILFALKREGGSWKIDDITDHGDPSIRSYFRTTYGG